MFGIGETELVIIVVFAFLLFGPDKLPGMGRTLGRVLRQFREASDGFTEVVQTNIMDPASEELEKSPKQRRREQVAQFDEDADIESAAEEEPAPRRETFAERKARLKAEREAREAEQAAQEALEAQDGEVAESQQDVAPATPADGSDADAQTTAEPARTSAADLWAMTSRKSSRSQDSAVAQDTSDESGEEAGSDQA